MTRILPFLLIPACLGANLTYSTYLRQGFTPFALSTDARGNVYVAGSLVLDPASLQTSVAVAKVDPAGSTYLYLTLLDSAAADHVTSLAVDSGGNAYIAGWTTNPNFSSTGGALGNTLLGTAPSGVSTDPRSFIAKLNPDGSVAFAVLLGGSVPTEALGIALTPSGQIVVSGLSAANGFPAGPSAGTNATIIANWPRWYLTELDASAGSVIFSVPDIGGSSLVVDAQGNIYMAGSSLRTDYPTTPGAYQTKFSQLTFVCYGNCQLNYPGNQQHVTKVDPTGKIIYSTGLGAASNYGLAVDSAGNAYVTGLHFGAYPFTVPSINGSDGYLTKLDPTGSSVLFSIPMGGAGVQVDVTGAVYAGGIVTVNGPTSALPALVTPPPVLSQLPKACWPNPNVTTDGAYVMKVDPASGAMLDAQWIDGSAPGAVAIAMSGGRVWITGATPFPDVPYTPGALSPATILPGPAAGAYLAAADFSKIVSTQSADAPRPVIACVLDEGNMMHVGAVAPLQLITLFGTNLGPAQGAAAPDGTDTSIAGVSITFNGTPAQLFYVSASQINVAVPIPPLTPDGSPPPSSTIMQVNVNGIKIQRQFPFTASNLNLFADLSSSQITCPSAQLSPSGFQPLATNADGSLNSCANPAKSGSIVSLYAHGAGAPPFGFSSDFGDLQAIVSGCAATIQRVSMLNAFVYKIDLEVASSCAQPYPNIIAAGWFSLRLSRGGVPVAPLALPPIYSNPFVAQLLPEIFPPFLATNFPAQSLPMIVWVAP